MGPLRRLIDFYRVQAELVWNWRRGRRQLAWRAIVAFFVAAFALGLTAFLLPGVRVDSVYALAVAVVVIGALGALVRPLLLTIVAPISLVAMLITALVFQVGVFIAIEPFVPGYHLAEPFDAVFAAIVFAIINSFLSWLLSLDNDDSYYSMLVRRLLRRRPDVKTSKKPGFVIVQIDGLSHQVLMQQVQAGRVPVMSRWVNHGRMRLGSWTTLLPSQTSASQAGILFGSNDNIPPSAGTTRRKRHSSSRTVRGRGGARAAPDPRRPQGPVEQGRREHRQPSVGWRGTVVHDLEHGARPEQGPGPQPELPVLLPQPVRLQPRDRAGIAEAAKEIFQAYRARVAGIEPRLARGFPYPFLRAATNVVLRPLCTSLVIEEMLRGTSVIYVTYTDYDEIAHHSGPQRAESLDALDGIDHALGSLARAARMRRGRTTS